MLDVSRSDLTAGVAGSGTMGAGIAIVAARAGFNTIVYDTKAEALDRARSQSEGFFRKSVERGKLKTEELPAILANWTPTTRIDEFGACDIVIEAISERMDWKSDLYKKVAPHLGENTIFASNTSGLSINTLAQAFPENLRHRFCGVHFFNPPRYMHLVELIACKETEAPILDQLEKFLVSTLGKEIGRAHV